jgi:excisionase family DNA binding protein
MRGAHEQYFRTPDTPAPMALPVTPYWGMTVDEASAFLGISKYEVRRMIARAELPTFSVSGNAYVPLAAIYALKESK